MSGFSPSAIGYFGKLPALGDFCSHGLPESFVQPWDAFCRDMLVASRAALGGVWEAAWMEAPIWHFLLPAGACGPAACCGVWLPSVDRVGRHYPFAIVALGHGCADLEQAAGWLGVAEATALSGILEDAPHQSMPERLAVDERDAPGGRLGCEPGWWTAGNSRVFARHWLLLDLPNAACASALLADTAAEVL